MYLVSKWIDTLLSKHSKCENNMKHLTFIIVIYAANEPSADEPNDDLKCLQAKKHVWTKNDFISFGDCIVYW